MGEAFALLTAFIWSLGIFPFTEASKRLGPLAVNNFRLILAVVFLSLFLLFFDGETIQSIFQKPDSKHWIFLALSGLVGLAIGDYFSFASFAILGARLGSIFATLSPAFVFIIATIFIDEKLNLFGIAGILITLLGVMMVVLSKKESKSFQENEFGSYKLGLLYGVLSALCQSIGVVLSKFSFEDQSIEISSAHAALIRMIGATIAAYIAVIALGKLRYVNKPILENRNNGLKFVLLGTLCGPVVGMMTSMYALSHINASVAQTIFSLVPVFVLFLNFFIYKEKISMRSLGGAIIAIAGVYILVFRDTL
jgi:hypothetical protein